MTVDTYRPMLNRCHGLFWLPSVARQECACGNTLGWCPMDLHLLRCDIDRQTARCRAQRRATLLPALPILSLSLS